MGGDQSSTALGGQHTHTRGASEGVEKARSQGHPGFLAIRPLLREEVDPVLSAEKRAQPGLSRGGQSRGKIKWNTSLWCLL